MKVLTYHIWPSSHSFPALVLLCVVGKPTWLQLLQVLSSASELFLLLFLLLGEQRSLPGMDRMSEWRTDDGSQRRCAETLLCFIHLLTVGVGMSGFSSATWRRGSSSGGISSGGGICVLLEAEGGGRLSGGQRAVLIGQLHATVIL